MRSEKGFLPVIVIVAALLLGTVGLYFINTSTFDLSVSKNMGAKIQSQYAAEYGLQQFLKAFKASVFGQAYAPTSGFIPDAAIKEASYTLLQENPGTQVVNYALQPGVNPSVYHSNPTVEDNFSFLSNLTDVSGHVAVSGVFNKSLNASEFYIGVYLPEQLKVRIYRYQPQVGGTLEFLAETNVVAGDTFEITAIWNDTFQATSLYFAVGSNENKTVTVYGSWSYAGTDFHIVDTLSFLDPPDCIGLSGVWDENISAGELYLTVLSRSGKTLQTFSSYPTLVPDFELMVSRNNVDAVSFDTAAFWDGNIHAANLFIGLVDPTFGKFDVLNVLPHIDTDYSGLSSLTVPVHEIGLGGYWDSNLNTTLLMAAVGDANNNQITPYVLFPGVDSVWQPKTAIQGVSVGKLSLGGVFYDFSEIVLTVGVPRLREVTITKEATILGKDLEVNSSGGVFEEARTTIKTTAEIKYTESLTGGNRVLKSLKVVDAEYDV